MASLISESDYTTKYYNCVRFLKKILLFCYILTKIIETNSDKHLNRKKKGRPHLKSTFNKIILQIVTLILISVTINQFYLFIMLRL
jgi:hypothetical protein